MPQILTAEQRERKRAKTREWLANNKERRKATLKKWNEKNGDYYRRWREQHKARLSAEKRRWKIEKRYGITVEQYDAMIAAQGGRCFICKEIPNGPGNHNKLHLDHCHVTGKPRAMICSRCNLTIGMSGENVERLRAIIEYLK